MESADSVVRLASSQRNHRRLALTTLVHVISMAGSAILSHRNQCARNARTDFDPPVHASVSLKGSGRSGHMTIFARAELINKLHWATTFCTPWGVFQ